MPVKYIDELQKLPESTLNNPDAMVQNMVGEQSGVRHLFTNDLHLRALRRQLTPNINLYISPILDEISNAAKDVMPQAEDWVEIDIADTILQINARTTSQVFVGSSWCRNPAWIKLAVETTLNTFQTVATLRMMPSFLQFLHPVLVWVMPCTYRLENNYRDARTLIIPVIEKLREERKNEKSEKGDEAPTLLSWMADYAENVKEGEPDNLAKRQIALGIGSTHTIKHSMCQIFYDFCAYSKHMKEIREEIEEVLIESGKWDRSTLDKLWKLDSFMLESQRMGPPQICTLPLPMSKLLVEQELTYSSNHTVTFHHRTRKPVTLSDGTRIPTNTQIGFPAAAALFDPEIISNPETFDPLRYYRSRLDASSGETKSQQFGVPSHTHMHFGYGKHSCPGRVFANYLEKIMVSVLLLKFDFRLVEGKERPKNVTLDEFMFFAPGVNLSCKRRSLKKGIPDFDA
ncbi:hypothetical protein G7Y89_g1162 [Cudoniella acicularis]|uniref:Cytochrome P450 n=1 Tax=Cudoniella acicularis TaxID=354080 RepID=A0A8H4RWW2_9HELO|nr:hypothetical protein G7Y89_g1162 [Cudoniella acicularis]